MSAEIFPPKEDELNQLIQDITHKMETVDSKKEYDQLQDQLKEIREQKRQLIIKNNAL